LQKHLHFILIDLLLKLTKRNDANNCIVNNWIACHATNLFKDNWRKTEVWLMPLV